MNIHRTVEPQKTRNYERTIGRIEGKLDHLIEAQNQMGCRWEELTREFSRLCRVQDAQAHEVATLAKQLDEAARPAHEFGRWRERAVGALMLVSLGGALIGGSALAFWQKLSIILR